MVGKQRRLILSGAHATKPGGWFVYSTCTFAPEENEGIVTWLLGQLKDTVELQTIQLPIANTMPGLLSWQHVVFEPSVQRTIRVLPTPEMEGFFMAKFLKLRPTRSR